MKKSVAFAAIAIVAVSGIFAQPKEKPTKPEVKLPEESVVKEYHASQMNALKTLKDAQVKAGICNQEQAEAAIAVLKAAQSKCDGRCILQKRTDIPFGGMRRAPQGRPCHRPMPMGNRNGFGPFHGAGKGMKAMPPKPNSPERKVRPVAPKATKEN